MARITVEDSLRVAFNRFALVILTSQRTKQLLKGSGMLISDRGNRDIVTALREIAAGKVRFAHPEHLHTRSEDNRFIDMDTEFVGDEDELD